MLGDQSGEIASGNWAFFTHFINFWLSFLMITSSFYNIFSNFLLFLLETYSLQKNKILKTILHHFFETKKNKGSPQIKLFISG